MTPRRQSDRLSDRVEYRQNQAQVGARIAATSTNESSLLQNDPSSRRATSSRIIELAQQLDERDLAVLAAVVKVRVLTGQQIERIFFRETPSAGRQARRLLARLVEWGVLARLDRRIGGRRAGSAGFVYVAGTAGQRLTKSGGPAHGRRVEHPWTPTSRYFAHLVAVAELFTRLREAELRDDLDLLQFDAEPACWRRYPNAFGHTVVLKPDAFCRVAVADLEFITFIETDLDTESPATLDRKLDRYRQFIEAGGDREQWGIQPQVTWVVPTEQRRRVIADAVGRLPARLWDLFRVTVQDDAVELLSGGRR